MFGGQHILSCEHFKKDQIMAVMQQAATIEQTYKTQGILDWLKGKILATLFFEPSTRTRLSFESAMIRMGGHVITVEQGTSTSANKGETLQDMARVVSCYADVVAMRHPNPYSVMEFAATARVPVLNAGDGANEHPTQALLDFYTIYKLKQDFPRQPIVIGMLGDLKNARTAHSLIKLLKLFEMQFILIASPEIQLPRLLLEDIQNSGCCVKETHDLSTVIDQLDVLYALRLQRERFENPEDYQRVKGSYQINSSILKRSKPDLIIMHPLPRLDEIDLQVDRDPRACYFQQVENGLYVRMALLWMVLKHRAIQPLFSA